LQQLRALANSLPSPVAAAASTATHGRFGLACRAPCQLRAVATQYPICAAPACDYEGSVMVVRLCSARLDDAARACELR
jgi:hypothetical protein